MGIINVCSLLNTIINLRNRKYKPVVGNGFLVVIGAGVVNLRVVGTINGVGFRVVGARVVVTGGAV